MKIKDEVKKRVVLYQYPVFEKGMLKGFIYNVSVGLVDMYNQAWNICVNNTEYDSHNMGVERHYNKIISWMKWKDIEICKKLADLFTYNQPLRYQEFYNKMYSINLFGLTDVLAEIGIHLKGHDYYLHRGKKIYHNNFEIERIEYNPCRKNDGTMDKLIEENRKAVGYNPATSTEFYNSHSKNMEKETLI